MNLYMYVRNDGEETGIAGEHGDDVNLILSFQKR